MVPTGDDPKSATLVELDRREGRALVRFSHKAFGGAPERMDLLPPQPLRTEVIEQAIARVVEELCADTGQFRAIEDLLRKLPPRFTRPRPGPIIRGDDVVAETIAAIADLDHGVLAIRGRRAPAKPMSARARSSISSGRASVSPSPRTVTRPSTTC